MQLKSNAFQEINALLSSQGISFSYLHGYLAAVAISPRLILPSVWLEDIFGSFQKFEDDDKAQNTLGMLVEMAKVISTQLIANKFKPLHWDKKHQKIRKINSKQLAKQSCYDFLDAKDLYFKENMTEEHLVFIVPMLFLAKRIRPAEEAIDKKNANIFADISKNKHAHLKCLPDMVYLLYRTMLKRRELDMITLQ